MIFSFAAIVTLDPCYLLYCMVQHQEGTYVTFYISLRVIYLCVIARVELLVYKGEQDGKHESDVK